MKITLMNKTYGLIFPLGFYQGNWGYWQVGLQKCHTCSNLFFASEHVSQVSVQSLWHQSKSGMKKQSNITACL